MPEDIDTVILEESDDILELAQEDVNGPK